MAVSRDGQLAAPPGRAPGSVWREPDDEPAAADVARYTEDPKEASARDDEPDPAVRAESADRPCFAHQRAQPAHGAGVNAGEHRLTMLIDRTKLYEKTKTNNSWRADATRTWRWTNAF